VENTLHGVNANVANLTHNFTHFMDKFSTYYLHHKQPPNDGNDEGAKLDQKPKLGEG
jgi:hypothetical protein